MKYLSSQPLSWRVDTLLSLGTDHVHELALRACGSLTSLRLLLGRCLLALHQNKGYKQFGCSSSVHYAAQILGIESREARECRRVARELQPLVELSLAAELGTISWSKLREVVRKAAPETEGYWLVLCRKFNAKQIQKLVRETPWGALPGDVFEDEQPMTTELRCPMSPQVFRMLAQARRLYSIEQEQAVSNAEIVEMALATYIAGRPADIEVLQKARDEADKDLQAEVARRLPLVHQARELAQDLGLLGEASALVHDEEEQPRNSDLLAYALGGQLSENHTDLSSDARQDDDQKRPTWVGGDSELPEQMVEERPELCSNDRQDDDPKRFTCVAPDSSSQSKTPASLQLPQASWVNPRLRFNPRSRLATKAQRKDLLRRDGQAARSYLESLGTD